MPFPDFTSRAPVSRRQMLGQFANGFGLLGLASLLGEKVFAADAANPLAVKAPPFPAKAKRVIFLFMSGGPSHVDLFDPKPKLAAMQGQPLPFEKPKLERTKTGNLLGSPWKFAPHGQSGTEVSELLPHIAGCVDDICVIRSMVADNINHNGACLQMNTGEQAFSRPSLGSWLLYGLGTENQNLPGFVVISPRAAGAGRAALEQQFPAGIVSRHAGQRPKKSHRQSRQHALLPPPSNAPSSISSPNSTACTAPPARRTAGSARASNPFELAFRMQREAPEAFDVERESPATKKLYGLGEPVTDTFGKQCLMARRLVERGVRMVQVYHTATSKRSSCQLWDQHGKLREELANNCAATDQPVAALLQDLKARGLLEDTLVIWGGEFGRTPTAEGTNGREHHPFGFTMWLAGGGVKSGIVHGATDEFGWHAIQDKVHVHDLHATILHLMGFDHEKLTYRYAGRDFRLTDVSGRVVNEILA